MFSPWVELMTQLQSPSPTLSRLACPGYPADSSTWMSFIQLTTAITMLTSSPQTCLALDFPGGSDGKASAYNVGDLGSIPGLGRSPGEGNGNPLQYSCLENPMDRGAW
ncbi:unnamed protein product [Rangifer tarandus platyrhynchus]|uniref:Uncharacterized protein n=1 Tax=Rangifer tarandus platyrhynchus TaxID=3082113 RepID=A0AC59Y9Q4_RANTA